MTTGTTPSRMIDIDYLRRALQEAEDRMKQARSHVREAEAAENPEQAFGWRCRAAEAMGLRDYVRFLVAEGERKNGE